MRDPRLAWGTGMNRILGHPFRIRSKWSSRVEVGIRTWLGPALRSLSICYRKLPGFAGNVCRFLTRNFRPHTTLWLVEG